MRKLSIIKPALLACSAGLLLTACKSDDHYEHASYSSQSYSSTSSDDAWMPGSATYSSAQEYSSGQSSAQSYSAQPSTRSTTDSGQNIVIPLHEEQVKIGKRSVDAGQVTIRKIVTTKTVSEPIQLRQEELIIDRSKSSGSQSQASSADQSSINEAAGASNTEGGAFQEKTYTIRLQKEEPVIQKNVIQTGQVTARKDSQTQQQTVQQQVRKEDVQLDKSGADVEIRGNVAEREISEPSGAEQPKPIQQEPPQSEYIPESESIDSQESRVPTKGLGAQDLKNPPDE